MTYVTILNENSQTPLKHLINKGFSGLQYANTIHFYKYELKTVMISSMAVSSSLLGAWF
jgi:hypothetical protein